MAVIKCKMCGGDLNVIEGSTTAECEYCGSLQTVHTVDNEKKNTLFARANRLRFANEFDKASGVYETIVAEFPEEAEAYWGLVLCKYGIEYVDDPATLKKIPTCHRSSFDCVLDEENFEMVMEYADAASKTVYRSEAKAIEALRTAIIEISGKEEPYDIFISYKDTDDLGQRTVDSVIAQDVYEALTAKGYRVFFSRISLEDKLGTEYEPYIFAALNSAKIMLVFGTSYDYFNAIWVKNEWSRYLQLMTKDKSKHLIPCFKDIDAYDMPKEFRKLSAQDMGKVGAMQDLLRGVGKILPREEKKPEAAVAPVHVAAPAAPGVQSLLKRGHIFLEDKDWKKADEYFDKVLDIDPECGDAYAGKLCATFKLSDLSAFKEAFSTKFITVENYLRQGEKYKAVKEYLELTGVSQTEATTAVEKMDRGLVHRRLLPEQFEQDPNYKKAMRYGGESLKKELQDCVDEAKTWIRAAEEEKKRAEEEKKRAEEDIARMNKYFALEKEALQLLDKEEEYHNNASKLRFARDYIEHAKRIATGFDAMGDLRRSEELAEKCRNFAEKLEAKYLDNEYSRAIEKMNNAKSANDFSVAEAIFMKLGTYKDSVEQKQRCYDEAEQLRKSETFVEVEKKYQLATDLMGKATSWTEFADARRKFEELKDYKDSAEMAKICIAKAQGAKQEQDYQEALEAMRRATTPEHFDVAIGCFEKLDDYKDSKKMIQECKSKRHTLVMKLVHQKDLANLRTERSKLGLFDGKKKKELDAKIAALEAELKKL